MKMDNDGEEHNGSGKPFKHWGKKFRVSKLSRRGSKGKFSEDLNDENRSPGAHLEEQSVSDFKTRTPLKAKVNQLLRRASTASSVGENGVS